MGGRRRAVLTAAVVLASLGSTAGASLLAAPPAAAATCTDNWQGPTTGTSSWTTAADWSTGVPTSTSVVCIALAGSYTVDLTSSATINTLQLGGSSGTQTLEVDGTGGSVALTMAASSASTIGSQGVLALDPTASGYAAVEAPATASLTNVGLLSSTGTGTLPAYIETPVTNQTGGTVAIGAADTRQDESTLTTNNGTFTVTSGGHLAVSGGGSFTDAAGSLTLTGTMTESSGTFTQSGGTESGNPVVVGGVTLADSAGTGAFDVTGTSTLSGTVPSGQTVTVDGVSGSVNLSLPAAVTDDGTVVLKPSASGYAELINTGGLTVASGGVLSTSASGSTLPAYFETPVVNQAGGTITIGAPDTRQDTSTLTTNDGTFTVAAGGHLAVSGGGSFTDAAGTLTLTGTLTESSGTFTQSGGTESGNPVVLGPATLADSAGTGAFDVTATSTLSGSVPSGQTVTVDGVGGNVNLSVPAAVTDDGSLVLKPSTSGYAELTGAGGLTVASGGTLSSTGASGTKPAYIETPVTNQAGGTVTVGAADTRQDVSTLTTNDGTFSVTSGGHLAVSGGSSFTDAGGTLTLTGTMTESSGTFTQSGGTESGNPVVLGPTTLADSAGTGAFDVTATSTLSGTIPSGQTVTVDGVSGNVQLALPTPVTDDGTLALKPSTAGYADITNTGGLTVAPGGTLSSSGASGTEPAYIETPVTNQAGGTITVGAVDTRQDESTTTANSGTLRVVNGGELKLSGGATVTTAVSATVGVTVNGTAGAGGISGPGLALAGTLAVTTLGSPSVGTTFTPISGPVTGTFSAFSFGPAAYAVTYPSASVLLTTEAPFTMTASPFGAKENVATGTVQLAAIGAAGNGTPGGYTATVNWGDGSPTGPATVTVTGATGTVTAGHTYAHPGTDTVTTTLANTDGTTLVTTESVTVTGPTITGLSKTTVKQGKKLTTVVSGTGFDASVTVTTSNPGITVVSAKVGKASKKHPHPTIKLKLKAAKTAALGPVDLTLTETDGTTTDVGAVTVLTS